jgi:hypothetical protein
MYQSPLPYNQSKKNSSRLYQHQQAHSRLSSKNLSCDLGSGRFELTVAVCPFHIQLNVVAGSECTDDDCAGTVHISSKQHT